MDVPPAGSPRVICPCSFNAKWSIRWEDLGPLTYIGKGGFGKVYSAMWRGNEVHNIALADHMQNSSLRRGSGSTQLMSVALCWYLCRLL